MLNGTAFTKVSLLLTGLDATWMERPGDLDGKKDMLVKYFHRTLRTHNSYVFKFVFCEILNLVNILAQVKIDDILLLFTPKEGVRPFSLIQLFGKIQKRSLLRLNHI